MKIFWGTLFILMIGSISFAQQDSVIAPAYKRFPTIPPFKLLGPDSVTVFTKDDVKKNKAVLLMLFNPECDHCKYETQDIIKNIDAFKKIQIIMATTASITSMKEFYNNLDLGRFKNIQTGRDFQYMLPSFYMIRSLPYLAMYDKKGKLLTTFEGAMKIEDLIKVFD